MREKKQVGTKSILYTRCNSTHGPGNAPDQDTDAVCTSELAPVLLRCAAMCLCVRARACLSVPVSECARDAVR